MKIVQTYWSLPSQMDTSSGVNNRNQGGWLSAKLHAMSWAFSCLKFKQFYPDVTLYTDAKGNEWLIDQLQLPYTDVKQELDALNHYNPLLWALPKIYTYAQQTSPFIHADGDVYIWSAFKDEFVRHPLLVQNLEVDFEYYKEPLQQIANVLPNIPAAIKRVIANMGHAPLVSINAGIIGGQDCAFFKDFAKQVFDFVDQNIPFPSGFSLGNFNIIFEQLYFIELAKQQGLSPVGLFEDVGENSAELIKFNITPLVNQYVHTIGVAKKNLVACGQLDLRLKYEFPKMHQHITNLYKEEAVVHHFTDNTGMHKRTLEQIFPHTSFLLTKYNIPVAKLNFNDYCRWIEELYFQHEQEPAYKLISDIYQIEKADYLLHHTYIDQQHRLAYAQQKIDTANKYLYTLTSETFLQLRFTIDTDVCQLAYLSYQYDEPLTATYLQKIVQQGISLRAAPTIQILAIAFNTKQLLNTKWLTGWNILFQYFDDNILSGAELIEIIRQNKTDFRFNEATIEKDILNFITTGLYYYSYLKIVGETD